LCHGKAILALIAGFWLILCLSALPGYAQEWDVTAESFVIMNAKTGKILLSLDPHRMMQPASTQKIMTAMYVREKLDLHDKVPVSSYAASAPPSKVGLKPGEVYTVEDLLYALLLSSGNDAARALAERVSGSEEAFGRELTRRVREWGAYRTRVVTANGLTADGQYSSAEDLAILFRRFIHDPVLVEIMNTKHYNFPGGRELRNHDRFLFTTDLAMGGKTGYTRAAKHTYVGRFGNGSNEIIVAMMQSSKKWADLRTIVEKGFELSGTPIAALEPKEERLWAGARPKAKYAAKKKKYKSKQASTARAKVILGSTTSLSSKPKTVIKRKSRTAKGGS
jgi:D-alanyl-D-alanine carboxypeptidase (penicillin-binding protein 5/6)